MRAGAGVGVEDDAVVNLPLSVVDLSSLPDLLIAQDGCRFVVLISLVGRGAEWKEGGGVPCL